jgi:hypothetical protein
VPGGWGEWYLKFKPTSGPLVTRIKELTARVTDKAIERAALTKAWVIERLRENAEKALEAPHGSAVANRALELLGTELSSSAMMSPPSRRAWKISAPRT